MMKNNNKILLRDNNDEFKYNISKIAININFNRVAFIFFVFFFISTIYFIHLIYLGSKKSNLSNYTNQPKVINKLLRADIVDRNDNFLAKTVSSIDIGINPVEIIDDDKYVPTGAVLGSGMYGSANSTSSSEDQFCSECGGKNSSLAKFCRECGMNLV